MNKKAIFYNEDCVEGAKKYLNDNSVDLLICDPPFGIEEASFSKHYYREKNLVLEGYVQAPDDYYLFSYMWLEQCKRILKENGSLIVISGWTNLRHVLNAVADLKMHVHNHIIWKYNFGVFTKKKMVSSHYHVLHITKSKKSNFTFNTYCRFGFSEKTTEGRSLLYNDMEDVWVINKEYNPGEFKSINKLPEELVKKLILYYSNEGDDVCDFFMGNFTTASCAKKLGRFVTGFELNEKAFKHFVPIIDEIKFGCDLETLKKVNVDTPENQGKKLSENEIFVIQEDFKELLKTNSKMESLQILSKRYGRGRWSLERIIKR